MENINNRYNIYFISAFVIIFVFSVFKYPTISYNSEVWAELGTNYLWYAMHTSFIDNMFTVDAGYLVWLPRLVAWITYKIFPLFYYPYITNFIGLAFIAFSLAFINARDFRSILQNDKIRFFLSLILGLFIVPQYENYTFVNFSYHGIFFCLLVIFLSFEERKNYTLIIFSIITALFCISKFHFLMFLPVYLLIVFRALRTKNYSKVSFFIPSIITMLIQIINVINILKTDPFIQDKTVAAQPLSVTIRHLFQGFLWYIQAYLPGQSPLLALMVLCVIILIFYKLVKVRYINERLFLFWLAGSYLAIGFASISCLAALGNTGFDYIYGNTFMLNRLDFITYDFVFLMVFILLYHYYKYIDKKAKVSIVLFFYSIVMFSPIFASKDLYQLVHSNSSWQEFYTLFDYPDYFIPINPRISLSHWSVRKDCDDLMNIGNVNGNVVDTSLLNLDNKFIRAIYVRYPNNEELHAFAYDKDNKIIGEGKMLSRKDKELKYILFVEKVSPYYIKIIAEEGKDVMLNQKNPLLIVGK